MTDAHIPEDRRPEFGDSRVPQRFDDVDPREVQAVAATNPWSASLGVIAAVFLVIALATGAVSAAVAAFFFGASVLCGLLWITVKALHWKPKD
ncbi:MAG: hypothetical protein QOF79_1371 [Actinomycetota bacterium]|jgi:hypothetical protein|nr:hypothetical protein [Actinomycetota bacterium]